MLKVKVTVNVQSVTECLSGWYLLNCWTFCYQTCYGNAASWTRVSCRKKNCFSSSRPRSQRGLIWSKYDSFYYIFWTADSLATKLGLMIYYHKPECFVKKNGLLRPKSRSQQRMKMSMFVQMISSKRPIILLPVSPYVTPSGWMGSKHQLTNFVTKLGVIMHHHEPECHAKLLVCYFQGQGHSKDSCDQNMTVSTTSFELLIL